MNVLVIAWNGLIRLSREREALFWIFVGPVIFTLFFGILFKPRSPGAMRLAVVNQDADDYLARALSLLLQQEKIIVVRQAGLSAEGWTLVVPPNASADLAANRPVTLVLRSRENEETNAERNLRFKIQRALMTTYLRANPSETSRDLDGELLRQRLTGGDVITLRQADLGIRRREITSGFQRSVPSYLIMFVFLNLLVSGAGIAEERANGQLKRIFIAPVTKTEIILGNLLRRMAVGWIQIAYMLLLGVFLFKIQWAAHPWVLFGFLTLLALASAALGILFGTFFKDPDKCATLAVWTAVLLSPLGGLWWPLEVVGPTMRKIAYFVPTGWAMEGVNSMLAFGAGARDVAPFALGFVALAAVSLTLSARRLQPS